MEDKLESLPEPDRSGELKDLVVITGYSGAGKSTVMNVFEDAGYFCVDNLPPEMIRSLVELFLHKGSKVQRAAIVSDVRGGEHFEGLAEVLQELADSGVKHRVIFLQAEPHALLTRYKETRRRHPLAPAGSVEEGIAEETKLLEPVRARADLVIDSTEHSVAALRQQITRDLIATAEGKKLAVTFESFGFKHGPPRGADITLDVRFLPNPHYDSELRPKTGHQAEIQEYIDRDGALTEFENYLWPLFDYLLPQYVQEGKSYLLVAIGCTGGRHRSVATVERLAKRYNGRDDCFVTVLHRDIEK